MLWRSVHRLGRKPPECGSERLALKVFGHFAMQQICLPFIRTSYGQDRALVTFKQCQLKHTVIFFINFNSVDI